MNIIYKNKIIQEFEKYINHYTISNNWKGQKVLSCYVEDIDYPVIQAHIVEHIRDTNTIKIDAFIGNTLSKLIFNGFAVTGKDYTKKLQNKIKDDVAKAEKEKVNQEIARLELKIKQLKKQNEKK